MSSRQPRHSHSYTHAVNPLPRALTARGPTRRRGVFADAWGRMDRVQLLGADGEGHGGCVNALSWSEDGATLLSGSDDKRICIWTADTRPTSPATDLSPHPLKLSQTIITGHRANIFSARFLPNSGTPTIVSCAGDGDIRVFEIERLQPADGMDLRVRRARGALWGVEGPGVRVLRCHRDRTKRIATEASPFLFLTVSEDGTVRQHDLRRPHTCRDECPQPLFKAPDGVDLYSLSVSPLTPHLFAVAGQTDCAYVCDRRKPEHQTPSWGRHTRRAEQVTCVRRLALPAAEWESVERRHSVFRERHITCVKMSADNAGEVICAFARHSTSLFSLNDSPAESSARMRHATVVPPNPESNTRKAERENGGEGETRRRPAPRSSTGSNYDTAASVQKSPPTCPSVPTAPPAPKRRISSLSRPESRPGTTSRQRTDDGDEEEAARAARAAKFVRSPPASSPLRDGTELSPTSPPQRIYRPLGLEWEDGPDEVMDLSQFPRGDDTNSSQVELDLDALLADEVEDEDVDMEVDDGETSDDMEEDDDDDSDDDDSDDDDSDDDDDDSADMNMYRSGALSSEGEFKGVEVLYPRKSYKGARNVETVKDCNFLGDSSDKVASGSDDGNWFVWDKETARLDGIWWGDSDIVNVMEQHPTLPIVAVSGIDSTVKMFAPVTRCPAPTFNRTPEADRIVERNMARPTARPASILGDVSAIQLLASMLRNQPAGGAAENREAVLDLFRSIGIVRVVGEDDDDDHDHVDGDEEESMALVPREDSGDDDE